MQLMDQLEQDYHSVYPEDPPVLEEGFEKALHQMVIKWFFKFFLEDNEKMTIFAAELLPNAKDLWK